jgi:hypothetical protein
VHVFATEGQHAARQLVGALSEAAAGLRANIKTLKPKKFSEAIELLYALCAHIPPDTRAALAEPDFGGENDLEQ